MAAVRFLDECAPDNWDYDKFGRPDVYFMAHEQQLSCKARDDLAGGIPYLSYDEAYEHREDLLGNVQ